MHEVSAKLYSEGVRWEAFLFYFYTINIIPILYFSKTPIKLKSNKRLNYLLIFKIYVFSDFKTQTKVLTGVFMSVTNKLLN